MLSRPIARSLTPLCLAVSPRTPGPQTSDGSQQVQMLKYEAKGSYASRKDQRLPGDEYFMENPLYGMFGEGDGEFYFRLPTPPSNL